MTNSPNQHSSSFAPYATEISPSPDPAPDANAPSSNTLLDEPYFRQGGAWVYWSNQLDVHEAYHPFTGTHIRYSKYVEEGVPHSSISISKNFNPTIYEPDDITTAAEFLNAMETAMWFGQQDGAGR